MPNEFDKRPIEDLGHKLAHLEGILGAYLPSRVFDSRVQQEFLNCDKFAFSRLRSGQRKASNWELGRFVELFDLARYGLDYRLFFAPFAEFCDMLKTASVGSHGVAARLHLREALRSEIAPDGDIRIRKDPRLNVGGIGHRTQRDAMLTLTSRDRVVLEVPLVPEAGKYLLLLHDFPRARATSCLMPSEFAPTFEVSGTSVRLPLPASGELSFPVGGKPGYRCIYGLQTPVNLARYIDLVDPEDDVSDIHDHHVSMLVDYLQNISKAQKTRTSVCFAEYVLA